MSRHCQCTSRCRHYVRSSAAPLLTPERLVGLSEVLATLVDAADAYDSDSLQIDPECGIHGYRAVSNAECICAGDRYTAAEFVQALMLDVRSAPQRRLDHHENLRAGARRRADHHLAVVAS